MKKENLKYVGGILLFYILIVFGVVAINARMEYVNEISGVVSLNN